MQSPQLQRKSFRHIWRDAGKAGRCGLIAVGLIIVGSLCVCVNVLAVHTPATPSPTPTTIAQNSEGKPSTRVPLITPTHTSTGVRHLTPTALPTKAPKPAATPLPTPQPTSAPQQPPTRSPVQTGVNGNPWGYNFTPPGNDIYSPPATFCDYFTCIASFWKNTNGYVDECVDGTYSHSGGVRGACSHHSGELRPLYSH
jgi:hypothetical protein